MRKIRTELPIPPDARQGGESFEVLRAWLGSGTLHCSLRPEIWPDAENWGLLLADLARYVAVALEERMGANPDESLRVIQAAFAAEMEQAQPPDEFMVS